MPWPLKTEPASSASQATAGRFKGYMNTEITLDRDSVNALRPEWNSRWNKTVER